ncbi:MAG: glycosyltransferase [Burkholderiaceae bacterium]|nr:glycosyltransferase [Burkholderiaceae bacterium]
MSVQPSPLITVATVVRNGASTIEETVRSVAAQRSSNFEYIVIDGLSSDGTPDILSRYRDHIQCCISERDHGIYDAMNKACAQARGKYLLFLGADDKLHCPETLARLGSQLLDPDAIYYGDVRLASSGHRYCGQMHTYKLMQQNICHQSILYPRVIYKNKCYDTSAGLLADYKYNIELWGQGQRFNHIDLIISDFNDLGASSRPDSKFEAMRLPLIREHLGEFWYGIKLLRNQLVQLKNWGHQ